MATQVGLSDSRPAGTFPSGLLLKNPVAVEKLAHSEFAKIGSRQEAL
jgi:hypothetical protein